MHSWHESICVTSASSADKPLLRHQQQIRKVPVAVAPSAFDAEIAGGGEGGEAFVVVLVRVLGVDRFAFLECDFVSVDQDPLRDFAYQMHLDASLGRVVEGAMRERGEFERPAELAIDADEEIEVE